MASALKVGLLEIELPTASDPKYRIDADLAELFGLEYTSEAVERLKKAWKDAPGTGRLDLDADSDSVMIVAGKDAILRAALLINELSIPSKRQQLSDEDVDEVRARLKAHKRPRPHPWRVGDLFALPLKDGSFALGQVLWEDTFAPGSKLRAPTCALFDTRLVRADLEGVDLAALRGVSILHVLPASLDDGVWVVIGHAPPVLDPFSGPCGEPGKVGAVSWDGLGTLAHAWWGLEPWNPYGPNSDYEKFLLFGVTRPEGAHLLTREELLARGINLAPPKPSPFSRR